MVLAGYVYYPTCNEAVKPLLFGGNTLNALSNGLVACDINGVVFQACTIAIPHSGLRFLKRLGSVFYPVKTVDFTAGFCEAFCHTKCQTVTSAY